MAITMQILLPILIPLMISTGSFTSGGILNPVILGAITVFNTLMQKFILPAIFISAIFILINSMTDRDYVNKLAKFIRGAAVFATGLAVTFFGGITMIQGVVTQSADGLLVNTARYSVSNFVPIVGGFAADSIDMVLGCIRIIKTGVGIFGVIILVCLLVVPLIKIIAISVIYKLTAIIIEPIGNKQASNAMNEMGNAVITMAVILFLTSLMFLVFMTIIIGIGGGRLWR
jgi:stage III sporulation protein AE